MLINSALHRTENTGAVDKARIADEAGVTVELINKLIRGATDSHVELVGKIYQATTRGKLCLALYNADEQFDGRASLQLVETARAASIIGPYLQLRREQRGISKVAMAEALDMPVKRLSVHEQRHNAARNVKHSINAKTLVNHLAFFGLAMGYCGLPPLAKPGLPRQRANAPVATSRRG